VVGAWCGRLSGRFPQRRLYPPTGCIQGGFNFGAFGDDDGIEQSAAFAWRGFRGLSCTVSP
jgi:hypothetical protein